MNFYIVTFGCKVNQCESDKISALMSKNGYTLCESLEDANVIIINSCTVTGESDRKLRQSVRKIKKFNPDSIVVLTGCMPQASPEVAKNLAGIDIIIGNSKKYFVVDELEKFLKNKNKIIDIPSINIQKDFQDTLSMEPGRRCRAFLKIEDGCNRFCSYCIIPYARGRVRSLPLNRIKEDIENLVKNGYKEIVLVGINLFSYGEDINCDIADAVKIACSVDGIERVRLGSLEPDLLSDDLIDRLSIEKKLCPQFHLSLQSGSDKVLKLMRRKYNIKEYVSIVEKLKNKFPDATFTTDLMVGFTGETDENFRESLEVLKNVEFLKVHVFPYSIRPGTLAEKFKNPVEKKVKTKRVKEAIEFSERISKIVLSRFLGRTFNVLYETVNSEGMYEGYTDNYIYVKTASDVDICGKIVPTKIYKIMNNYCLGKA
ncbi:MAG: tRNA (N(6)-L-threonylcarbamoyladenosine(37)-C(2))-methylthiotransferase MtaB [Acutalibacteraceae bacterium]